MKRKRFSVEQITAALGEAERGMLAAQISRRLGISNVTFYLGKKAYSRLEPSQVREIKQLKEENAKLKRIVADLSLDKVMLQDVLSKIFRRSRGAVSECWFWMHAAYQTAYQRFSPLICCFRPILLKNSIFRLNEFLYSLLARFVASTREGLPSLQ